MNSVYRVFRVIIDFIFKFSSFIHKRQESICNGKKKRRSFLKVQYKSYHQTCVSVIEFIKTAKHLVTFIESKQQYFWRNFNVSQRLQSCLQQIHHSQEGNSTDVDEIDLPRVDTVNKCFFCTKLSFYTRHCSVQSILYTLCLVKKVPRLPVNLTIVLFRVTESECWFQRQIERASRRWCLIQ
jgi:hypothetical protein